MNEIYLLILAIKQDSIRPLISFWCGNVVTTKKHTFKTCWA